MGDPERIGRNLARRSDRIPAFRPRRRLRGRAGLVESWGDPRAVIYPRSAAKMIQALPLIESGAADAAGLGSEHLALACASHNGAPAPRREGRALARPVSTSADDDLRCGPALSDGRHDRARDALIAGEEPRAGAQQLLGQAHRAS
jgi:L-asparaginase II